MRNRTALLSAAIFAAATPAYGALCTIDSVPAATVLLPYFEASTTCGASATQRDTIVSVFNPGAAARLARVTLWTNAAVPAQSFDIYLNGYDQQTFSVRALLCNGTLPQTGRAIGSPGRDAGPVVTFTGCSTTSTPGTSPVYAPLDAATTAHLRAYFTGQQSPSTNNCASIATEENLATGYVTIDAVTQCGAPVAGTAGFEAALAATNALAARAELLDSANNFAVHYSGVPLEAAAGTELDATETFYGSAGAAGDRREPLPSTWGVDYDGGTPGFGGSSELLIWRDVGAVGTPFACGTDPAWYPLNASNRTGYGSQGSFFVSDAGVPQALRASLAPLATQRVVAISDRPLPAARGWTYLNLQHSGGTQAWVARVSTSEGRYATLEVGTPFDSSCDTAPFNNVPPGNPASLF